MTRQTRLVAILLVIAVIGVSGLMVVANQYRKALGDHAGPKGSDSKDAEARAARWADGFLAARLAVRALIASSPERPPDDAYRTERMSALTAHGMSYEDYVAVRRAWRAWKASAPVNDPTLAAAFEARRGELEVASLGAAEVLDDSIK